MNFVQVELAGMPMISFDVLVPHDNAEDVATMFATAMDKLLEAKKLDNATVAHESNPQVMDELEEQLRQTYAEEHEEQELADAGVHRYVIHVEGVTGSLNGLAMTLGRLLTPHAALPQDHVLLEDERSFEVPAIFPWAVNVSP